MLLSVIVRHMLVLAIDWLGFLGSVVHQNSKIILNNAQPLLCYQLDEYVVCIEDFFDSLICCVKPVSRPKLHISCCVNVN